MRRIWTDTLKPNLPWIALILALGLLPFLGFLTSGKLLYASDQIASPSWKFFFDALRQGELPLWSYLPFGGMPTYDALAGDATYPPFILLGLFLPVEKVVGFNFLLHCLLAGLFAFTLLRGHFKLDRFLATALAVAYMLNTQYLSHIYSGHTGKFHVLTWLPLGLYFLLGALEKRPHWSKLLGLSLTTLAMVLTSHLQLTYFVLMGYFCYFVFKAGTALREGKPAEAGGITLRFWAPILLGIGLCFPLFWAPLKYNKEYSVRGDDTHQTYEHATSWSMHAEETASLLVPEFGGLNENYWGRNPFKLNSEYPGITLWVLGLLGLFLFRRPFFYLWGGVGLLAILYGLGADTPLFHLFYAIIPGIKSFRAPSMILFWLVAALLLMSAQGLRLLTVERGSLNANWTLWSKRLLLFGGIAGGVLILGGLLRGVTFGIWNSLFSPEGVPNIARQDGAGSAFTAGALRAGLIVLGLTFAIRQWLLKQQHERAFAAVLLGAVLVDLYWVDSHFIETYDFDRVYPREAAIDELKADTSAYRVFSLPGILPKGYLQYHNISYADGWIDQEYRLYRTYRGEDYNQNPNFMAGLKQNPDGSIEGSRFLDMLNVKYLLYRLPDVPGLHYAENKSVLPRAWFVPQWESLPADAHIARMRGPDFDPRRLALIDEAQGLGSGGQSPAPVVVDPAPTPTKDTLATVDSARADSSIQATAAKPPMPVAPAAMVQRETYRNNDLIYRVKTEQEGVLVVSENWFPYWQVRVDGQPQTLLRVNYLFRGVHLKPGEHRIEMAYHSGPLRLGLMVSLAALLALTGLCVVWARLVKPEARSKSETA